MGVDLQRVTVPLIETAHMHGLARLQHREQVLYLTWCFAGEVDNGGYAQFFFNSSGEHAAATVRALREVGCPNAASLLERAIALFPHGVPVDIEERNRAVISLPGEVDNVWVELDQAHYKGDGKSIYDQLRRYWELSAA